MKKLLELIKKFLKKFAVAIFAATLVIIYIIVIQPKQ